MVLGLLLSLGSTITYENPGIRLELLLKELSNLSGESLHCPTTLKNEVLAASFENQSIDIVKTQLARVIHGTWTEKEDGWWLVQTGEQQKEEREWNAKQRHDLLQMQIDGLKAQASSHEWSSEEAEKYARDLKDSTRRTGEGVWNSAQRRALRLKSPEARMAENIARSLKPDIFENSGLEFTFQYYADIQIPFHTPLSLDISNAMRQYASEAGLLRSIDPSSADQSSVKTAAHLEISVDSGEIPYLSFTIYDRNWHYVQSSLAGFWSLPNLRVEGEKFPFSAQTTKILELETRIDSQGEEREKLEQDPAYVAANRVLLNAVKQDPLGIKSGQCWIDFARFSQKPLVVNLEEEGYTWRPRFFVPTISEKPRVIGMQRLDEDGWILGRPTNPLSNRSWRMDRSTIQEIAKLRNLTSRSLVQKLRDEDLTATAKFFTRGIPGEAFMTDTTNSSQLFAVLGGLTEGQLADCLKGKGILVTQLPKRSQTFLIESLMLGLLNDIAPDTKDGLDLCPSVAFPNGLQGMTIEAKVEPDYTFTFPKTDTFSSSMMAHMVRQKNFPEIIPFQVQHEPRIRVALSLGQKRKEASDTIGYKEDFGKYTWRSLPDEVKRLVLANQD